MQRCTASVVCYVQISPRLKQPFRQYGMAIDGCCHQGNATILVSSVDTTPDSRSWFTRPTIPSWAANTSLVMPLESEQLKSTLGC
eukprot:m.23888 g.23888  ORF g.23888 m.23888 type:complete len:85 (-) comp11444_c0_seq3:73-327(-)